MTFKSLLRFSADVKYTLIYIGCVVVACVAVAIVYVNLGVLKPPEPVPPPVEQLAAQVTCYSGGEEIFDMRVDWWWVNADNGALHVRLKEYDPEVVIVADCVLLPELVTSP